MASENCMFCNAAGGHAGRACPNVEKIEYYDDGRIKRVKMKETK